MPLRKAELDALREAALRDPGVPEPVRQFLSRGAELEEIRLDARGRWIHEGSYFENEKLAALFSRSLEQTDAGTWLLRIAPYTYPVIVEATGFFITRIVEEGGRILATVSDGIVEELDRDGLRTDGETVIVTRVHRGRHDARFVGQAWQWACDRLDHDGTGWFLRLVDENRAMGPLDTTP